ncbi:MAG: EAL domain-containing protein [Rhodanobacter sp.]
MKKRIRMRGRLREQLYRSVAETLVLLHTAPGSDRRMALMRVADTLRSIMELPLVWIGRVEPTATHVDIFAASGPAAKYVTGLNLNLDADSPGGRGPTALAFRDGQPRVTSINAPEFAPWRQRAEHYGFGWHVVAGAGTSDGGHLLLSAYAPADTSTLGAEVLDWAQRLTNEMVRFWDHQSLLERDIRLRRYRDAQRNIQRALLDQPDPSAVYVSLARALVEIAGAVAVDVYSALAGDPMLTRQALAGPMANAIRQLPHPPCRSHGPDVYTPTLAFMRGEPVVRVEPFSHPHTAPEWRTGELATVGAIGGWPILAERRGESPPAPIGVFVVVTLEPDAFDPEMCSLLDEIADAAALALRQHEQRHVLFLEQARQTYLALHDDLTHLPNRRALDRRLDRLLERARKQGQLLAVGVLDMDDLKPLNDRFGHAAGDRVLIEIANRVRSALRAEDYVARVGGDEFVLVFENLSCATDLDPLVERIWQALQQPMLIEDATVELSASLGVALFPLHGRSSGAQLLRRADQAMYAVKLRKRTRRRWWAMPSAVDVGDQDDLFDPPDTFELTPYGASAAALLGPSFKLWEPSLEDVVYRYYAAIEQHDGAGRILQTLRKSDVRAVRRRMVKHLRGLLDPQLELAVQRDSAMRSGVFNAAWGLEEVWLLELMEVLRNMLVATLGFGARGDRRPLEIVLQRIALEQQWQLESMRKLQRHRVAVLNRLNALAWSADSYLELIQGAVDILVRHDEILASAVGRPDPGGELTYEAIAGTAMTDYLRAVAHNQAKAICVDLDCSQGRGPCGRAWRGASIERSLNYATDPAMSEWREVAHTLGIVSSVAVPLSPLPLMPVAVLVIYSAYFGGFQSEDQRAFVGQIKAILDLALLRLAPPRHGTRLLPFFERERWRRMVADGMVQTHYQPVVRLDTGAVCGLEALARLEADDGTVLLPGTFFPALGEAELVQLFHQVLVQAMACRQRLASSGMSLDISINVPAAALEDERYRQAATSALASNAAVPGTLLLEILESPMLAGQSTALAMAGMMALKHLGFRLVQDDLGAGYSSLIRLRQWPFDRVKIDQAIVLQATEEPVRTLRFMRQLISLGHSLGVEVVVEGLETPGMIEAALSLGADLGQGYALAWPMPEVMLLEWSSRFRPSCNAAQPRTALGKLAAALLWEEQFEALPQDAAIWRRHATGGQLAREQRAHGAQGNKETPPGCELENLRDDMHAAAVHGPGNVIYQQARARFFDLLAQRVLPGE